MAFLCVTSNEIDADVGEAGEEKENEELSHRDDFKPELSITLRVSLKLDFILMSLSLSARLQREHQGYSYKAHSSGLIRSNSIISTSCLTLAFYLFSNYQKDL